MTYLEVVASPDVAPNIGLVSFVVPGHQLWRPRAFHAVAHKEVGGAPDRSYVLNITDGTNTVASIGAADAGDEPGTCEVTWAPTPSAASSAGSRGIAVAPLTDFVLPAGYRVDLLMVNTVAGDQWVSAVAWVDYSYDR